MSMRLADVMDRVRKAEAENVKLKKALAKIAKHDLQAIALIALGDMEPKSKESDQ